MKAEGGSDIVGAAGAKPWWRSRAIIGALLTVVAGVASLRGLKIEVENLTEIVMGVIDIAIAVAGLVGAGMAIWGRWQANCPVYFLRKAKRATPEEVAAYRRGEGGFVDPQLLYWFGLAALWAIGIYLAALLCTAAARGGTDGTYETHGPNLRTFPPSHFPTWCEEARAPKLAFGEIHTASYKRPFLARLVGSLGLTVASTPTGGTRLAVSDRYLSLRGGNETLDALARSQLRANAYAIMLKGGVEF